MNVSLLSITGSARDLDDLVKLHLPTPVNPPISLLPRRGGGL